MLQPRKDKKADDVFRIIAAVLSAVFAGFTSILAKCGIRCSNRQNEHTRNRDILLFRFQGKAIPQGTYRSLPYAYSHASYGIFQVTTPKNNF